MSNPSVNWYNSITTDDLDDLKLDFAVAVEKALDAAGKKRADLARALNVTPSRVTAILSGDENLTMEVMYNIADAIDYKVNIHLSPRSANGRWSDVYTSSNTVAASGARPAVAQLINLDLPLAA